ncbi:MAG: DUF2723 domain-containing protein [Chloroflexia bacterium]
MQTPLLSNRERLLWLTGAALTLLWLLIYLTTVSPTVNFIDSGELITAVREPGIAHPPGYPLYVLLGFVASHLLWGDEAWRVNVFSAFWGAMAVGAFFVLIYRFSTYILTPETRSNSTITARTRVTPTGKRPKQHATKPEAHSRTAHPALSTQHSTLSPQHFLLLLASSAAGASLLAASSTFWSRTAQAKMYSLHFFFVALILNLALGFRRAYERNDPRVATRWLIALAATLGLSFTNHLMTILLVIPVALLLLVGDNFMDRLRFILQRLLVAIPAFVVPLLLYLYMPIRAAQNPIMNWGSTDNFGDFYRHISGWQFRPYLLGDIGQNLTQNSGLITRYASEQWSFLTVIIFIGGIIAAALVYKARPAVFWPTLALFLLTLIFSMFYGISEIEPYMTMFYAMLAVWLGLAPAALIVVQRIYNRGRTATQRNAGSRNAAPIEPTIQSELNYPWMVTAALAILVLSSVILIYPKQNYSQNRLAEQYAINVFNELPQNSLIITDYWDFYAPTYYLQLVKGVRSDITIVDKSLLRYPWYTTQLRTLHPWLAEKSQDIFNIYSPEQRKWVNGENYNGAVLQQSYFNLLTSFVERNIADHPAYFLMGVPCQPNQNCEENQIAPTYQRIPAGLSDRLVLQNAPLPLPASEPTYHTDGLTTNYVSLDDAARINSTRYADAYARLAALYNSQGQSEAAQRMNAQAVAISDALKNR